MNSKARASSPRIADILALGFGTGLAMWAAGYFCRLPFVSLPTWLAALLMLACLLGGGYCAGRQSSRGWVAGLLGGLTASVINLLILGSLLSSGQPNSLAPSALIWLPGSLLAGALLGAIGGMAGASSRRKLASMGRATEPNWLAVFATITAGAALLLIAAGGLVTSEKAGLAVVDWPNSFGYNMFLYPLSRMTGGIYFEHAHRLLGSLTGLCVLVLALQLQFTKQARAVKLLGWGAFVLVSVQGLLGGLRVTGTLTLSTSPADMSPSTILAAVHGVTGQLVFALLGALAVLLSTQYGSSQSSTAPTARVDHLLGKLLVASVILQVMLGAVYRHFRWGLSLHITVACIVVVLAMILGLRCWGIHHGIAALARKGPDFMYLTLVQFALGFGALIATSLAKGQPAPPLYAVLVATAHQTLGALVLAYSVVLALWLHRLLKPAT